MGREMVSHEFTPELYSGSISVDIGESSEQNSRRQEEEAQNAVSQCTVSQESLRLWRGDGWGTLEGKCPLLEAGTSGTIERGDKVRVQ
jgi:hypothetical protein